MEKIRELIYEGQVDEAIRLLDAHLEANPDDEEAYYLRGNAWRKKGNNRLALNNYLEAMERNPESPARKAHDMLMNILDFYHKDLYNP